ncbi:hypothetical protein DFP72DRAFT_1038768 [Ephemerocybe angulata]|uniref:Peptidase metallopeptidase domain-containing protein n=1 Tax=Ephemerocybe angulata TaxID=980116 RepID=A0A8H6MHQ6_9AGAR|nr:hypothetical protein DFP72DRAFT_1038768 [Tulosesus angulatus]
MSGNSDTVGSVAAQAPAAVVEENDLPEFFNGFCADQTRAPTGETRIDGMKAILTRAALMWENGRTLTVGFVEVPGTARQQQKVKDTVKEWEQYANLRFQFIDNPAVATIRISFRKNVGSWSYIGKGCLSATIPKTSPTMNFGWVEDTAFTAPQENGTILHEFGHAIGYLHEHQSPRRGEKLQLKEQVVIDYYARTQNPPWNAEKTRQNVLNVYNTSEVTNFSACDFTSIMMYFMPAEFNVQGIAIKPNNVLSPLDKAFAFLNYPFTPGTASVDPSVTVVSALNTIGITGAVRASIATEWAEGDWQGVRAEFTRWSVNQKALNDKAAASAEREEIAAAVPTASPIAVN